jgi:hypothetical protein
VLDTGRIARTHPEAMQFPHARLRLMGIGALAEPAQLGLQLGVDYLPQVPSHLKPRLTSSNLARIVCESYARRHDIGRRRPAGTSRLRAARIR